MIAKTDPLPGGGDYVAAAYLVLTLLLLIYFVIMAYRLSRLERDVLQLHTLLDARDNAETSEETSES